MYESPTIHPEQRSGHFRDEGVTGSNDESAGIGTRQRKSSSSARL
jgi:hypothetical protein